jgi:hypothetical protein
MRSIFLTALLLTGALIVTYVAGVRVFVVKPIGALPQGRTVIVTGSPGLRFIDSPDAFCLRNTGNVTLLCRAGAAAAVANRGTIWARLPYSSFLDWLAGTPETIR